MTNSEMIKKLEKLQTLNEELWTEFLERNDKEILNFGLKCISKIDIQIQSLKRLVECK